MILLVLKKKIQVKVCAVQVWREGTVTEGLNLKYLGLNKKTQNQTYK
jgi:hypothetical protein